MERNFSYNTGFVTGGNLFSESIQTVESPFEDASSRNYFTGNKYCASNKKDLIKRACDAYEIDGIIRTTVDRHAEMFTDFYFEGGDAQVEYLKKRFNYISLRSGEPWKLLFSRYVHEYFKHGNPFMGKVRGETVPSEGVKRPLYKEKPYPISALFTVSPTALDLKIKDSKVVGWKFGNSNTKPNLNNGGNLLKKNLALLSIKIDPESLANGADIIHTPYKKPSYSPWGIGFTFTALDDTNLLRNVEQITAIGLKKGTIPLLWHSVKKGENPLMNSEEALMKAANAHRKKGPDNVIVTPDTHVLKILGSESQSLRNEGYLMYYAKRVFAALGTSPFIMGFETGTIGTGEAAMELVMNRIRFCQQELSVSLEMFLINELLWEGGFDPYQNEKDQVKLKFKDIDEARMIKLQNHYTDLYTKNMIGLQEARTAGGIRTKLTEADLYLNKVQIPLERAKGEAPVQVANISAKATKTARTNANVEKYFEHNYAKITHEYFVQEFQEEFGIELEDFEMNCFVFASDPTALLEYLKLVII